MSPPSIGIDEKIESIRNVIDSFLQNRLQEKLDKLNADDESKRSELIASYQRETWVADAARRVSQIQQVTHALKYINPDAKGSSLYSKGNPSAGDLRIGTHTLQNLMADVVGNAAALDVNKFLRLEVDGQSFLELSIESDLSFRAALSNDQVSAQHWMDCFSSIVRSSNTPSSHKLAKQLYWPVGTSEYHLIAPLFPTSLVHHVWSEINGARFSEEAKAARNAHRENKGHPHGYRNYPNLGVQNFGGTKPQNISQLNSERGGKNYLLSSGPPIWKSRDVRLPLKIESVFSSWFARRRSVRDLIKSFQDFLYSVQDRNNVLIRSTRAEYVDRTIDELLVAADDLISLKESWSLDGRCRLNDHEKLWLNPYRAKTDKEFEAQYLANDWLRGVSKRFANWLNVELNDPKRPLPLGENEAKEWENNLKDALSMVEVDYDE